MWQLVTLPLGDELRVSQEAEGSEFRTCGLLGFQIYCLPFRLHSWRNQKLGAGV